MKLMQVFYLWSVIQHTTAPSLMALALFTQTTSGGGSEMQQNCPSSTYLTFTQL